MRVCKDASGFCCDVLPWDALDGEGVLEREPGCVDDDDVAVAVVVALEDVCVWWEWDWDRECRLCPGNG